MKVNVVGGGPAGLYAALLLKKSDPTRDVTVFERNPRDATYGWGVVFTERTLASLREADPGSHDRLAERFVTWDAIELRYRDARVRCGGHSFAAVERRALLDVLQQRCDELDVGLRFGAEVQDIGTLPAADLVIAADGINSAVRRAEADRFGATQVAGAARYIWLGTRKPLDAFTFVFRENEHGLFQAHCYPFAGGLSTVIVECDERSWRNAGLDTMSEDASLAYCEELLADDLRGHALLSNASRWLQFVTLRCRTWHHGNVVLLGDAAHTAHFSIGSGTKLAMEDAIGLARACDRTADLEAALSRYEAERLPVIDAYQQAAAESQTYFEHIRRYFHHEPLAFAFQLLTRSGRVSYNELGLRDTRFVDAVARDFAHRNDAVAQAYAPPPLQVPLRVGTLTIPERIVVAPAPAYDAVDGALGESTAAGLVGASATGAAVVLVERVAVSPEGRVTAGCAGLYLDRHASAFAQVSAAVHRQGTRLALQLTHAGRRGATRPRQSGCDRPLGAKGWELLAPSALPYLPGGTLPRVMEANDLADVRAGFVRAAARAAAAGVDLLELHCGHGYLLGSFLSPISNRREDGYGGDLEHRLRYPLEIFDAVRAAWGPERPLAVALPASDGAPRGLSVDDAVAIAAAFRDHGCDLVHVVSGQTAGSSIAPYGRGFLTAAADRIRNEAGVPVMVGGHLVTSDDANTVLAAGRADLCVMAPGSGLAD